MAALFPKIAIEIKQIPIALPLRPPPTLIQCLPLDLKECNAIAKFCSGTDVRIYKRKESFRIKVRTKANVNAVVQEKKKVFFKKKK